MQSVVFGRGSRGMNRKLIIALVIAAAGGLVWLTLRDSAPEAEGHVAALFPEAPIEQTAVSDLSFDPVAVAKAETEMWKAYYEGRPESVFAGLTGVLREQAHLSAGEATGVAMHFSMAAAKFKERSGNYESIVLPDLVAGYEAMLRATGRDFDAREAADAELHWWVLRRTPGRDKPESVGRGIARLYEELYGRTNGRILMAGVLRARAADLRDRGNDWDRVEELLRESYESLLKGIE